MQLEGQHPGGTPGLPGAARLALRRRFFPARHYGFFIRRAELRGFSPPVDLESEAFNLRDHYKPAVKPFDIFINMKRVEWDILMFF